MNIVEFLNQKNLTISSAESFTGGLFANTITNIPNASKCFLGSIISYDPKVKENILHVNPKTIENFGTISQQCAYEMVTNCQAIFKSDIAVSFTGNAGPNASENKPVGLCYVGFKYKEKTIVNELHLEGTREEIKNQAVKIIIELIFALI